jgi:nitroreductase
MAIDNEVLRAIRARRSTRKFTDEQILPEQLNALLEAAILAPSGGNNQSWLFTVIQSKDVLAKLCPDVCGTTSNTICKSFTLT